MCKFSIGIYKGRRGRRRGSSTLPNGGGGDVGLPQPPSRHLCAPP